ncbi:MAG: cytochrome c biogenesis protein CcdA [Planctomycetota bacterium]|nr:cytochrome c biogenesis protein CcdA [Planctomycetota bacterium]
MRDLASKGRRSVPGLVLAALATATAAGQMNVDLQAEWAFQVDAAHPGADVRAALRVSLAEGWHVNSDRPLEEFLIPTELTVAPPEGVTVDRIVYPEALMLESEMSAEPMAVFESEFVIGIVLEVGEDVAPGSYAVTATLSYQACNDRFCLQPESRETQSTLNVVEPDAPITPVENWIGAGIDFARESEPDEAAPAEAEPAEVAFEEDCDVMAEINDDFTVAATTGGFMGVDEFLQFVEAAETGTQQKGMFEGKGIFAIIALIIVGGVLLNLTPCVLPLIPINLAIIGAGAGTGSRLRGFALGGTYGLAMALVYGVLGLVVALGLGTFGEINSTIWFNVAVAILFVLLALAMFDIIHIDFSKHQSKLNVTGAAKTGTFALAFFMGAVTAILAGACVAPVVIQVMVYAGDQYAKGLTIALFLPFLLGVGLALPWPILGAGISIMPRPGMWMVRVKQALGVFILVFAGYYGYEAWKIYRGGAHEVQEGWTASICEGLAIAKAQDKPVFIDMWATWCKNCLVMDETTFKDEKVVEALENYVKVKYQAEKVDVSPARDMIELFNGAGLPTYAILHPKPDAAE